MSRRSHVAIDDPSALRSAAWVRFFGNVMARQMCAHFHAVRIAKPGVPVLPANTPVVIYCNHPAWWDAAFMSVLATRAFAKRKSFGPIDAEAIGKYGFMRRIGFFPVQPNTRAGAVSVLRIGSALLARADTLLWFTPEGAFTDPRHRPLALRPGLAALLVRVPRVVVLPLAIEYPFWTERTPEALARFGSPLHLANTRATTADELHRKLEDELGDVMDALARDAMAKDDGRFVTLLEGKSGIGGVYDAWRRTKSWARGQRLIPRTRRIRRRSGPTRTDDLARVHRFGARLAAASAGDLESVVVQTADPAGAAWHARIDPDPGAQ